MQETETIEQLEARLRRMKDDDKKKKEKARKDYITKRDTITENIITTAKQLFTELSEFKTYCHVNMDEQAKSLAEYGELKSTSKGGFSITNSEGDMRVTRRRDTEPTWDERSLKAIELIKEFLGDTIKKRDIKLFEILMSFLERNDKGDLEYSRVMDLYKHEDKFDDPRWKEGLRLIKESYSSHLKGFGYEFKVKGDDGKWKSLLLSFAGI